MRRQGRQTPSDAAPTGLLARLRHSVPCASDRGPRPGQSGPGLRVLPTSGSQFWAIVAPFTPDDPLFGTVWPPRGRWRIAPVELRYAGWPDPFPRSWEDWDDLTATLDCDDAPEPHAWWEPVPRRLGTWRTVIAEP